MPRSALGLLRRALSNAELMGAFPGKLKESPQLCLGDSALSKALEEGQEPVGWTVSPGLSGEGFGFGERLFFQLKVRVQVRLSRVHMFMAEPQRDDGAIHAMLQQIHSKRVPPMPLAA